MLALDPDSVLWNVHEEARREKPLLLLMHGRGSDERDLAGLMSALPEGFAIASVRAPIAEGFGWSWFEPDVNPPGNPHAANADEAADAVLAWVRGLSWAPRVVGTLGFSQGGAMAVHLMRRDPYRFAFGVNLAGFVIGGVQHGDAVLAERRPPVFWGRGADDELFTWEILHRTDPWLARHTTLMSGNYPGVGHTLAPEELRDVVGFLHEQLESLAPAS